MSKTTTEGTVCFLRKNSNVLLALIEYSPNDIKWNGIGGVVEKGETPEEAARREIREETYLEVEISSLKKLGEVELPSLHLVVFAAESWTGELKAKDPSLKELRWFKADKLPFSQMWEDNANWLPQMLASN